MVEISEQKTQDRWKTKYLDALDAHDQLEREAGVRVNELGTLIARLSRTLPGKESAGVQKRLGALTEALKRKPLDGRLSRDVNDVHARVLDVMELHDSERADVMNALRQAASQLERYCTSRKLKRGLKELRGSLARQQPPPTSEMLDGLGELQQQVLELASANTADNSSPSPEPDRLPERLPGGEAESAAESTSRPSPSQVDGVVTPDASTAALPDTGAQAPASAVQATIDEDARAVTIDWVAVREVLSTLLIRLSPPAEFKEQMTRIKTCIADGLDEDSLLQVLEQLRDVFDVSLAEMNREFRGFLDSVDRRLDTLLSTLGQAHELERAALTREQGLADSFQAHLNTMRDDAKSATDLAVLKSSIDEHLDTLVRSMKDINDEGRLASGERDARLMAMTRRLQELESESKQARGQLETQRQLALTDSLTGLANRKALDERIDEEMSLAVKRSTSLAVAIADIDHFKQVNDSYGHVAGDRALTLFARIISTRVRATDFCARYGGEEFVMLFPATDASRAVQVVEQVREFVESCGFSYKGEPVPLTASFGVTEQRPGDDAASLLERVDKAMYQAKSSGRNRVCLAQG